MERIKITPGIRSGKPCIRDTRITVVDILGYMDSGMGISQILEDFDQLEEADIHAAVKYAQDKVDNCNS